MPVENATTRVKTRAVASTLAVCHIVAAPVAGFWTARREPREPLMTGCLLGAVGLFAVNALLGPHVSLPSLSWALAVAGFGFGLRGGRSRTDRLRGSRSGSSNGVTRQGRAVGARACPMIALTPSDSAGYPLLLRYNKCRQGDRASANADWSGNSVTPLGISGPPGGHSGATTWILFDRLTRSAITPYTDTSDKSLPGAASLGYY